MRVLHVLYRLMPSGAEKMLFDASEVFRANGIEGYIFIIDKELGPFYEELRNCGYKIFKCPWSKCRKHLIEFMRVCRHEKIDVVQIHTIRGFFGFSMAAKVVGVRRIVKVFHGMFYPKDRLRFVWHMVKRHLCRLWGVKFVAISKSVQQNELYQYSIPTSLVWNWVDEKAFPLAQLDVGLKVRVELDIPKDAFVVLSVGNCHVDAHSKVKNHALILQALSELPNEIIKDVYYIHAGNEMPTHPERILAQDLGIAEHVRFLGNRSDIWRLLSAANLFLMSSLKEGLGNAVIEALFAGKNVLLTEVPGLVDFREVSVGVNYAGLEPQSFARALYNLKTRIQLLDGDNNIRQAAQRMFSMEHGVAALKKLYEGK